MAYDTSYYYFLCKYFANPCHLFFFAHLRAFSRRLWEHVQFLRTKGVDSSLHSFLGKPGDHSILFEKGLSEVVSLVLLTWNSSALDCAAYKREEK